MASWIKMRTNLPTDPRVVFVSNRTRKCVAHVLGACAWLWMLADEHTEDGIIVGYTCEAIDRMVGISGFCEALTHCPGGAWLSVDGQTITIPDFDRHNGESAKRRASAAVRAARFRNANGVTGALPREDKIRKEKDTPKPPEAASAEPDAGGGQDRTGSESDFPGFERFWSEWPKHFRKSEKEKCLKKWRKLGLELLETVVIDGLRKWKRSAEWTKENGQFIPAPHPWLNRRKWELAGELPTTNEGGFGHDLPAAEVMRILRAEGLTP